MGERSAGSQKNWVWAAFLVLVVTAFLTRLYPLAFSQYPYNNDSLTESSIGTGILSTGHLSIPESVSWDRDHSLATPALNLLLAMSSSVLGVAPLALAQYVCASLGVVTVGAIFLLASRVTGSVTGGVASALAALLMGTFVFTTGSVWKEMMGISLFVLSLVTFIDRDQLRYRAITFAILLVLPLVHHLVSAVAYLSIGFMIGWGWYFAISKGSFRARHLSDLLTIGIPASLSIIYYSLISFNRLSIISSPLSILVFAGSIFGFGVLIALVLSMKSHARITFAPLVGISLFALLILDYLGFIFPYSPSASNSYLVLVASFVLLLSIAWYGTEVIIEKIPRYRAIQVSLLVAPLAVVSFGLVGGLSLSAHQTLYRTFDFVDFFIFIGIGSTIAISRKRYRRAYVSLAGVVVVALLVSFPFGYYTSSLLGVRHDTQGYEMDALSWVAGQGSSILVVSDERVSYIASRVFNLERGVYLPYDTEKNVSLAALGEGVFFLYEDSWTTEGANAFPEGLIVLPYENYTWEMQSSNVCYIGGPVEDHAVIVMGSSIGHTLIFGGEE